MNVRKLALDTLCKCESAAQYANLALDSGIKKFNITGDDRSLFTVLVYGTIEHKLTLDYYIDQLSSLPTEKIDAETRNILRLGLYQMIYTRTADHAAVNETVSLAPMRSRGFVNAILRAYIRKKDTLTLPSKETDLYRALSVTYSFPEATCQKLCESFGADEAERLMEAMCLPPPLTLRVNTLRISLNEFLERLEKIGVSAKRTDHAPFGVRLNDSVSYSKLDSELHGLFFVQDEASQLASAALDAQKGDKVIDVCSCPGSKSFSAALHMENEGSIYAYDISKSKLPLIASGAERLGISIITSALQDGRLPVEEHVGRADRVICDVPCSGFGVVAKKPDIRYKDISEAAPLPNIQYDIICNAARYLKVGGTMIYSTCTVLPEENYGVIKRFLDSHGNDFELTPINIGDFSVPEGYVTLFPHLHGTDGFFICKLTRKEVLPPSEGNGKKHD